MEPLMTLEPTVHHTARIGVDRLIAELTRAVTPEAFDTVPLYGGASCLRAVPQLLAALPAARLLSALTESTARDLAAKARGAGATWDQVAHAARFVGDEYRSAAEAAYGWAADKAEQPWRPDTASWRCGTCTKRVVDHGPYDPHPADAEHGHAADCARHLAGIAAYEKTLNDEK
jgi:hypothetical protein